jgi:hypothetical protein
VNRLVEKYIDIRKSGKITYTFFNNAIRYLTNKERLEIEDFVLTLLIGLKDPFYTSIATGIIWAILGNLYSYLLNNFKLIKKSLIIQQSYIEKRFDVDFRCIITIKNVHIITVSLIYLVSRIQDKIYNWW